MRAIAYVGDEDGASCHSSYLIQKYITMILKVQQWHGIEGCEKNHRVASLGSPRRFLGLIFLSQATLLYLHAHAPLLDFSCFRTHPSDAPTSLPFSLFLCWHFCIPYPHALPPASSFFTLDFSPPKGGGDAGAHAKDGRPEKRGRVQRAHHLLGQRRSGKRRRGGRYRGSGASAAGKRAIGGGSRWYRSFSLGR